MRKILFISFSVCFLFLFSQNIFAQPHLRITATTLPDTAYLDTMYTNLSITITNIGDSTFAGDLSLFIKSSSVGIVDTVLLNSTVTINFLSGSVTDTFEYNFRTAHFDGGDNIVVVWPVSSQSVMADTFNTTIHFLNTGISEPNGGTLALNVYMNPFTQTAYLSYKLPDEVEQVRIFNSLGKEVFRFKDAVKTIDMSSLGYGIYFIEMKGKKGRSVIKKILKL